MSCHHPSYEAFKSAPERRDSVVEETTRSSVASTRRLSPSFSSRFSARAPRGWDFGAQRKRHTYMSSNPRVVHPRSLVDERAQPRSTVGAGSWRLARFPQATLHYKGAGQREEAGSHVCFSLLILCRARIAP